MTGPNSALKSYFNYLRMMSTPWWWHKSEVTLCVQMVNTLIIWRNPISKTSLFHFIVYQ
jgi:hypothetical protein